MQSLEDLNIESPPRSRLYWLTYAFLAAITALAIFLRVQQAGESLWLDELHTAWTVSGGLGELPHRAAMGNNSPLYFLLPWASTRIFGMSEWALRLPSLVAGTLVVPALFLIVWRWMRSIIAATLAAAMAMMDSNFLFFSLEARPYAAVQLVGLLQLFAFWTLAQPRSSPKAEAAGWRYRLAFVVLSVLLFYLHYTAVLLIVAEVFFLVIAFLFRSLRPLQPLQTWLLDLTIIAALGALALPHLIEIAGRRENWELAIERPTSLFHRFRLFQIDFYAGMPMLAVGLLLMLRLDRVLKEPKFPDTRSLGPMLLVVCCFYVPITIAYALSSYDVARLWLARYVIVAAAMPMLLGGIICGAVRNTVFQFAVAAITIVALLAWLCPFDQWLLDGRIVSHSEENWRDAVAHIKADDDARDWPVLIRSGLIEANGLIESDDSALREYCLLPVRSIYVLGEDRTEIPLPTTMPGRIGPQDIAQLKGRNGVWLITPSGKEIADKTLKVVRHKLRRSDLRPGEATAAGFDNVWVMRVPLK